MDKLTGAVAINCGALAGGNFPTSNLGVIFRGLADTPFKASPDVAAFNTFGTVSYTHLDVYNRQGYGRLSR